MILDRQSCNKTGIQIHDLQSSLGLFLTSSRSESELEIGQITELVSEALQCSCRE